MCVIMHTKDYTKRNVPTGLKALVSKESGLNSLCCYCVSHELNMKVRNKEKQKNKNMGNRRWKMRVAVLVSPSVCILLNKNRQSRQGHHSEMLSLKFSPFAIKAKT